MSMDKFEKFDKLKDELDNVNYKFVCVKQWSSVLKLNKRLESIDDSRLNKLIYDWMCSKRSNRCKNWSFRLLKQLEKYNIQ